MQYFDQAWHEADEPTEATGATGEPTDEPTAIAMLTAAPAPAAETEPEPEVRPEDEAVAAEPEPTEPVAVPDAVPDAGEQTDGSAARVLEIAVTTAEQLVADAQAEADALAAAAREEAEKAAAELADQRAQQTAELELERVEALAALTEEKAGLEAVVAALREREADYRTKMRTQLNEQLTLLGDSALAPPVQLAN